MSKFSETINIRLNTWFVLFVLFKLNEIHLFSEIGFFGVHDIKVSCILACQKIKAVNQRRQILVKSYLVEIRLEVQCFYKFGVA